jgi:hypothetical protein
MSDRKLNVFARPEALLVRAEAGGSSLTVIVDDHGLRGVHAWLALSGRPELVRDALAWVRRLRRAIKQGAQA